MQVFGEQKDCFEKQLLTFIWQKLTEGSKENQKTADLGEEHTTRQKPYKVFPGNLPRTALITTIKNAGERCWTKKWRGEKDSSPEYLTDKRSEFLFQKQLHFSFVPANDIFNSVKCPYFKKWYSGRILSNGQNWNTQCKDLPISHVQLRPEFTHIFLCKKWRREWGYWGKGKKKPTTTTTMSPKQNKETKTKKPDRTKQTKKPTKTLE